MWIAFLHQARMEGGKDPATEARLKAEAEAAANKKREDEAMAELEPKKKAALEAPIGVLGVDPGERGYIPTFADRCTLHDVGVESYLKSAFIESKVTAWLVTVAVQRRGCYKSLIWILDAESTYLHGCGVDKLSLQSSRKGLVSSADAHGPPSSCRSIARWFL